MHSSTYKSAADKIKKFTGNKNDESYKRFMDMYNIRLNEEREPSDRLHKIVTRNFYRLIIRCNPGFSKDCPNWRSLLKIMKILIEEDAFVDILKLFISVKTGKTNDIGVKYNGVLLSETLRAFSNTVIISNIKRQKEIEESRERSRNFGGGGGIHTLI